MSAGIVKLNASPSEALWLAIGRDSTGRSLASATVSVKSPLAWSLARSVAVTRILSEPTSELAGVPLKVRVAALKVIQPGRGWPSACVAAKLSLSPVSASVKASAARVKLKARPCVAAWSTRGGPSTGRSLALATSSAKVSSPCSPEPSVAITRMASSPTSALVGVPLKVRVVASKLSQPGSAEPSARFAA